MPHTTKTSNLLFVFNLIMNLVTARKKANLSIVTILLVTCEDIYIANVILLWSVDILLLSKFLKLQRFRENTSKDSGIFLM